MKTRVAILFFLLSFSGWSQQIEELIGKGEYIRAEKELYVKFEEFSGSDLRASELGKEYGMLSHQFRQCGNLQMAYETEKLMVSVLFGSKKKESMVYSTHLARLFDLSLKMGNYALAGRVIEELLEINENEFGRKSEGYILALMRQARFESVIGNLGLAEDLISEAFLKSENSGAGKECHVLVTHELARILSENGKPAQAENYYRQIENEVKTAFPNYTIAEMLSNFALNEFKLRNFSRGEELLQEAVDLLSENGSPPDELILEIILATFEKDLATGEQAEANDLIGKLLEWSQNFPTETSMNAFNVRSYHIEYLIANNHPDSALIEIESLLNSFRITISEDHYKYGKYLHLKATALYHLGKYNEAIEWEKKALRTRTDFLHYEHPDRLESLARLSILYWADGQIKKAKKWFAKSLYFYSRLYQSNFAFLSEKEKVLFYSGIREFYEQFNAFALEQGPFDQSIYRLMLDNQLLSKGLLFKSTNDIRRKVDKSPEYQRIYADWVIANERLNKVSKIENPDLLEEFHLNYDSLQENVNRLEKELSLRVRLGEGSIEEVSYDWKHLKYFLRPKQGMIEIVRVKKYDPGEGGKFLNDQISYLAFIITKRSSRPEVVELKEGYRLENRQLKYYQNTVRFKVDDTFSYEEFWRPIADNSSVRNLDKIYVSPDGVYNQLSLQGLFNSENKQYLIDEKDIYIFGNLLDIEKEEVKRNKVEENFMLFGYPDYNYLPDIADLGGKVPDFKAEIASSRSLNRFFRGGEGIALLPGTKEEVEKIDSLLRHQALNSMAFLENEANEKRIKELAQKGISPTVLHIATHGFFIEETEDILLAEANPLQQSGLLFAGASYGYNPVIERHEIEQLSKGKDFQDGILTASEAMNLKLDNTDLVVLSACETGLGQISAGEGVYGLQRAIQTAGANAVIMSLWKVDDKATNLFMQYFYQHFLSEKNKHVAFKKAQLKLKETYAHPYYWAAFVLVGE